MKVGLLTSFGSLFKTSAQIRFVPYAFVISLGRRGQGLLPESSAELRASVEKHTTTRSETFEPNMPDVEHVPSDGETSDIPAWGDLFPDDDEAGPSVVPKNLERMLRHLLILLTPMILHLWVEEPRIPLNSVALRVHQAHGHAPFGTAQVV